LNWSTSANKYTSYFQVERSINNQQFTAVGKLTREGEQETADYVYNDNVGDFADGIVYYRLRIIDINGNTTFSKILAAPFGSAQASRLVVSPNPVKNQAQLVFTINSDENLQIRIYNSSGELIHTVATLARKGRSIVTIPQVQNWPTGVYIVRANVGEEIIVQKLVVTK
jgi:hypothetical protein